MWSKSWLPVGVLLVGGTLLCGCNDPQKTNKSVMPPPQYPAGPYNPNSNVVQPGVGGLQPGTGSTINKASSSSAVPPGNQWGSPASSWNSNGTNGTTGTGGAPAFPSNPSPGPGSSSGLGSSSNTGYSPGSSSSNLGSSASTPFASGNMPPPVSGGPGLPNNYPAPLPPLNPGAH